MGAPRQIGVELPAGLIGDPGATPKCTIAQAQNRECPVEAAIGRIALKIASPDQRGLGTLESFLYNVEPPDGVAASFAFNVIINGRIDAMVTPEGGYRLRMKTSEISEVAIPLAGDITIWGIPAEFNGPGRSKTSPPETWGGPRDTAKKALGRNPTRCSGAPEKYRSAHQLAGTAAPDPRDDDVAAAAGLRGASFRPAGRGAPRQHRPRRSRRL